MRWIGSRWMVAAIFWLAVFVVAISNYALTNDSFDRLTRAEQILRYGGLPFRDFLDPGYFLSEFVSAALLWASGDGLLGELLLNTAFVASGTTLVLILSWRSSGSLGVGLAAALVAALCFPRPYDYDKVLFYPLGLWLCWRYVEHRRAADVVWCGVGLTIGGLFRYDTAVYLGLTAVVTMLVVHQRDMGILGRRLGLLVVSAIVCSLPALMVVSSTAGIGTAVDQISTYAAREWARTGTLVPAMSWTAFDARVFLDWIVSALPLVVAPLVAFGHWVSLSAEEKAQLAGLVVMCTALGLFILRDPVEARIGGIAGPIAVLSTWTVGCAWRAAPGWAAWVTRTFVLATLASAIWSLSIVADWGNRIRPQLLSPWSVAGVVNMVTPSPPLRMPNDNLTGLVRYVRSCTAPGDRILATWFVPELYFYAGRGFAGGMVVTFGGHWSEPRFQEKILRRLEAESVPVAILRTADDEIAEGYPLLAAYLRSNYRIAGTSDFGDSTIGIGGYTVLARNDRTPSRTDAATSLPCFA